MAKTSRLAELVARIEDPFIRELIGVQPSRGTPAEAMQATYTTAALEKLAERVIRLEEKARCQN